LCSQYLSAGLDYLLERGGFYNAYFHSGSIGFRFREDDFVAVGGFGSFIVSGSSALVIVGRIMFMIAVAFSFCSMGMSFRFMVVFIVVVCDGIMAMSFMTLCSITQ
jgi:hypothetical protein